MRKASELLESIVFKLSFFHTSILFPNHRSELRILQWRLSFFQVVSTILNKNHKIDAIRVDTSRNLLVIIDNAVSQSHDTVVHIHRYTHMNGTNDETNDDLVLDIKRTQMISTPYNLKNGTMFFYNGNSDDHLFMVFCDGNALHAMSMKRCEYFLWKNDGVDDTIAFQTIRDFEMIDGILLESYLNIPSTNNKKIVAAHDVLAFQMNVRKNTLSYNLVNIHIFIIAKIIFFYLVFAGIFRGR